MESKRSKSGECPKEFCEYQDVLENSQFGMIEPETSFETFIRVNRHLLTGLHLFSRDISLTNKIVNDTKRSLLPIVCEISQMMFLMICQIRSFLVAFSSDTDHAFAILMEILSVALCIFKGIRLTLHQVELRELLTHLSILWDASRFRFRSRRTMKMAKRSRLVRSWYFGMVIFIVGMRVTIQRLLLQYQLSHNANETFDYSATVYPSYYPFVIDTLEKYLACVLWEQFVAILQGLYWASCDTMFAQLVTHAAIQFQVLRYDLKNIGSQTEFARVVDEEIFLRRLSSIAKRHDQLFEHCNTIAAIYNPIIFLTMVSAAITMYLGVLNVNQKIMHGNHDEVANNVGHLITILVQSIIYGAYANDLTSQSFEIAQAAYQSQWIERSIGFKVVLQIIMIRAQKLYFLTGYGFFCMNLKQMSAIVNTAMNYFALLKTTSRC